MSSVAPRTRAGAETRAPARARSSETTAGRRGAESMTRRPQAEAGSEVGARFSVGGEVNVEAGRG